MITVGRVSFHDIPEYFLERYDSEIAAWASHFSKVGPVKSFVLKEGAFARSSPDPEQGAELLQVKLIAKMSRKGVEIKPYREIDKEIIAKHCARMQLAGVSSRARLVEPPRPWLPFMPNRVWDPPAPTEKEKTDV